MTEHDIFMRSDMVLATLRGAKTVTRRPVLKPKRIAQDIFDDAMEAAARNGWQGAMRRGPCDGIEWKIGSPFGVSGDRLLVRETWASAYAGGSFGTLFKADGAFVPSDRQHDNGPHYNADDLPPVRWRPSIHLPRWAVRLRLEVVSVTVQRLHSITEGDAAREGVEPLHGLAPEQRLAGSEPWPTHGEAPHVLAFAAAWDSMHAFISSAWSNNPWVWRVEYKVVQP